MKKVFTFVVINLIALLTVSAATRSRKEAMTLAIRHADECGISLDVNVMRRNIVGKHDAGDAPYYVFNHGRKQGWTIVSGDDRVDDIIGYATEGDFDFDSMPTPVQQMLQAHEQYIASLGDATPIKHPRRVDTRSQAELLAVGPFLTTRWDQYKPYNDLTPTSGSTHCATCCVATAFGQILYYLYHTQAGQSSSTFETSIPSYTALDGYLTGSPIAGPRTYDWSQMITDYQETYTDEQATAVATLLRDLGTMCQVNYTTGVSTANSRRVSERCATYFGLQPGSVYIYNSNMGALDWQNAVGRELAMFRPVLVASNDHAFVVDGTDGNGLYHINFGYSGRGDGWYTLDAMNGYGTATWGYTTGLRLRAEDNEVTRLGDICKAAREHMALVPVGNEPGQYRCDLYYELQTYVERGEKAVADACEGMNSDDVQYLCNQISTGIERLTTLRTPYRKGTYYIKTFTNYSDGKVKAMYAQSTGVNWGTINKLNANYKWYMEYDSKTNAYILYNVGTKAHFTSISTSTQAKLSTTNTAEVEIRPLALINRENADVYACTIRPMVSGYNTGKDFYCHQNQHQDGRGTGNSVVGWEPYGDANQWYFDDINVLEMPTASFALDTLVLEPGQSAKNTFTTPSKGRALYVSNNSEVAKVDVRGQVTAVAPGTCHVTVTLGSDDTYAEHRESYVVQVVEKADEDALQCIEVKGESLRKVIVDGHLIIERKGQRFNVLGIEL